MGDRQAGLAQLVVHLICNQGVGGSSPSAGTNKINDLDKSPCLQTIFCQQNASI